MIPDRREFLERLAAGAATLAGGPLLDPRPSLDPHRTAGDDKWDVSWAEHLTGRHRAVFDCPQISEGAALLRALIWIKQYGEVYGAPASEMNAVIVVRHAAIAMIMDDEFWDHHKLGRELKITDPKTRAPIARNPFFGPTPFLDLPAGLADDALGRALKVCTILACNLAFQDMVETVKKQAKVDDPKAREMALRHVVPGVLLQPSGVFAVLRAQEAGCQYLMAS